MDRMLVIVFDNESKAYEGKKALLQLDGEGSISLYSYAVLAKHPDGTSTIKQGDDVGPLGTLVGTSVGSLIGLLGGPAGLAIGATAGALGGGVFDLHNVRIADDFIDDVAKALTPNKVAVLAEADEEWTTPVDTRMEALGGTVYRRALSEVTDTVNQEAITAMKADLAQFRAEEAKADADRQAKIQKKISQLGSKIQAFEQRIQDRRRDTERQLEAKAKRLRSKADARPSL
ncbi:MAG TPA: DUF1269 domain-containing protein [Thermoanaerobaculia bacterium]|nr:DUF1269 domain-containing protein [Thermoanaerobaculia bacterium]